MAGRFSHMSLSSLLTDNQKLFLEKNQSQVDKFLSEIPPKFSFSKHQSELFEFYLYQSYGIDLEKKFPLRSLVLLTLLVHLILEKKMIFVEI
jgi:hypothetical protein